MATYTIDEIAITRTASNIDDADVFELQIKDGSSDDLKSAKIEFIELFNKITDYLLTTSGTSGVIITNSNFNISITPAGTSTLSELSTDNDGWQFKSNNGYHRIGRDTAGNSLIYVADASTGLSLSGIVAGTEQLILKSNGNINMQGLPTSSAGLVAGDLWNDSGSIKIV